MTAHTPQASMHPTPAEIATAELAATGLSNTEIANHLGVSIPTVQHNLSDIYAKLGIACRRDLAWALRHMDTATPARPLDNPIHDAAVAAKRARQADLTELVAGDWASRADRWWDDFLAAGR